MLRILRTVFVWLAICATPCFAANPATIPAIATVASLKALGAASPQYPNVYVMNYATAGDGGGGIFSWASTSTDATNLCTVFQATGVTTGRWVRRVPGNALNVDMCGARGAADSSVGFNEAFGLCISYSITASAGLQTNGSYLYNFSHNIRSAPGCSFNGVESSGLGGTNASLNFTNDTDGGACWTIAGPDGVGTYPPGNGVGNFVLTGNSAGIGLNAHCTMGIYVSAVAAENLHDIKITYINGPCLLIGNTQQSVVSRVSVGGCGTSTTAELEIYGESLSGAELGGTTLSLYDINVESDFGNNSQACVKIDRYSDVSWIGGDAESCGLLLAVASKASSVVGVSTLTIQNVDFENQSNGATSYMTFGTGWTGATGGAAINAMLVNDVFSTSANLSSLFVMKETSNFFANRLFLQAPNSGITVFDFQGTHNLHEQLLLSKTLSGAISAYVKVNGSAIVGVTESTPWFVDGLTGSACTPTFRGGWAVSC